MIVKNLTAETSVQYGCVDTLAVCIFRVMPMQGVASRGKSLLALLDTEKKQRRHQDREGEDALTRALAESNSRIRLGHALGVVDWTTGKGVKHKRSRRRVEPSKCGRKRHSMEATKLGLWTTLKTDAPSYGRTCISHGKKVLLCGDGGGAGNAMLNSQPVSLDSPSRFAKHRRTHSKSLEGPLYHPLTQSPTLRSIHQRQAERRRQQAQSILETRGDFRDHITYEKTGLGLFATHSLRNHHNNGC